MNSQSAQIIRLSADEQWVGSLLADETILLARKTRDPAQVQELLTALTFVNSAASTITVLVFLADARKFAKAIASRLRHKHAEVRPNETVEPVGTELVVHRGDKTFTLRIDDDDPRAEDQILDFIVQVLEVE